MQAEQAALVIGATGVTGTPMVEALLRAGWPVYAVSRRVPMLQAGVAVERLRHVAVDLTDAAESEAALGRLNDVTHLFYCAHDPRPDVRRVLLRHAIDTLERHAPRLRNVHLMQGTKYYGCHLGPFKVPADESHPRVPGADFYYSEEDWVRARQRGRDWTWTAVRPHAVCGYARGNPLNLAAALGIYGSLRKAHDEPFAFPASERCYGTRYNVADAELLARASIWCSTTPACGNQAFNVNNGDVFRWRDVWPDLARSFALEADGPQGPRLPDYFAQQESTWRSLAQRRQLAPFPYERLAQWAQGDYQPPNSRFACEYDVVSDLSKARRHGFVEQVDSVAMFLRLFERLRAAHVIP
jgi:nucleoside-diphosphate-sugar epimerase